MPSPIPDAAPGSDVGRTAAPSHRAVPPKPDTANAGTVEVRPAADPPASSAAPALHPAPTAAIPQDAVPAPVAAHRSATASPSAIPHAAVADAPPPAAQLDTQLAGWTAAPSGHQQLTIRFDPAELGRMQVTIAQPKDGPATVTLLVERPETMLLLLRDQPQLQHTLTRAGVPEADRQLTIALAPPATAPVAPVAPPSPSASSSEQASSFSFDARSGQQAPRDGTPPRGTAGAGPLDPLPATQAAAPPARSAAGVDITA